MKLVVYADGASRGNPGPAAIGVSVVDSEGRELASLSRQLGVATNNQAEYTAAIEGVRLAARLGAQSVELRVDSELLARQLEGRYRVKDAKLRPLYDELMRELGRFREWRVSHVRREENRRADALANLAFERS
ncbi:14.7 kDa ribonuclease H-like protein [bacterium HR29]|jgi:ribonuclease HI|nr:14.7 kDa ribonuclease H-like protein [bacterium HR29]